MLLGAIGMSAARASDLAAMSRTRPFRRNFTRLLAGQIGGTRYLTASNGCKILEQGARTGNLAEKREPCSHFSCKVPSMAVLLVVDDDAEVLEAVCAVLAGMGHSVDRAPGGLPALEILERKPIDLLLTDVMMPGLHGFNLARMAVLRQPAIKVLYFSGYTEYTIERDEGQKFGKLLHKPLTPDELRHEVEAALAAEPRQH